HPGFWNMCVHKGLAPGPPDVPERGNPTDIPTAAGDWPQFNFIIYHSCIRNGFFDLDSLETIRSGPTRVVQGAEVPDISWTTQFAELSAPFRNVYAELGTTFAGSVVTFPTVWAHIIGQLLKFMGPDRIVFGSDTIRSGPMNFRSWPRPYRVRFGLALVWRSPVADRRLLAVPDPRGDPGAVGLPGAHRGQPAQDPRPELGGAVQATERVRTEH